MKSILHSILLAAFIFISLNSCDAQNKTKWGETKIQISEDYKIQCITNLKDSLIYIGGYVINGGRKDLEKCEPFLIYSLNKGITWQNAVNVECNSVEELEIINGFLVIRCLKYIADTNNPSRSETVFYYLNIRTNKISSIQPLKDKHISSAYLVNDSTIIFNITHNQFGSSYIISKDFGNSWNELHFIENIKYDLFQDKAQFNNLLWGVGTKFPDSLFIASLNFDTKKINEVATLKNSAFFSFCSDYNQFYVIVKEGSWLSCNKINNSTMDDTPYFRYRIREGMSPRNCFLKDNLILIIEQSKDFFPSYAVNYKKTKEEKWQTINVPNLVFPFNSFDHGHLYYISVNNILLHLDFNKIDS